MKLVWQVQLPSPEMLAHDDPQAHVRLWLVGATATPRTVCGRWVSRKSLCHDLTAMQWLGDQAMAAAWARAAERLSGGV